MALTRVFVQPLAHAVLSGPAVERIMKLGN